MKTEQCHIWWRAFACTFLLSTAPAWAQTPAEADDEDSLLEEVIITGSRIRQDPLEQRLPVMSLSSEDYAATGSSSLAEFIQKLPISGSAINRSNNSSGNLGFPPDGSGIGAGSAEIDLRYLTSKRVLVLVDGRRWIKGSSASGVSGAVDLNSIPANAVKSIEILQDGASAIYGSDAIGGVVNIITVDDYDSFKASAQYGQYDESDGESLDVDVRFGAESERTRVLMDINYIDQKDVSAGDRSISLYPLPGFPYGASSGTPYGRFVFSDAFVGDVVSVAPDAGVSMPVWDPLNPAGDDFHGFTLDDRFNYQPFNHLLTPNKRVSIFAKAEFDITDNTMFRVLASYNNRQSQGKAAPEPLFFGPDSGSTPFMVNTVWPANHPYNPFGQDLGPDNIVFFGRRPIEAGPRVFDQEVDTWYISAGIDGQFNTSNPIYWDATFIWAENNANQEKQGAFNARRIFTAMGDPDVCAATPNCVPLNIVGAGSMTQEMLDYVTFIQKDSSKQEMSTFTFNLTGQFGNLPAGSIGWAAGFEYREEDGRFTPDPIVAAGETAGVPAAPTNGGFDVNEFYGEVIVPILADRRGANRLDISAALRYSDYNLFSSETVSKLAINWAPTENLVLRAAWSEGFRAPNIGELFNTGSRFDASISDRCSNVAPEDAANCAALGVPPDYMQLNPQISVSTGGNPDLTPETAETITFGFSWDLPFTDNWDSVDGFLVEANYYDIDIEDAIQAPVPQDVLDGCIDTLQDVFCNAVNRTPNGTITRVEGVLQNIGGIETSGL